MLDNIKEVVVTFPNLDIPVDQLMKVINQGVAVGIELEPLNCGFVGHMKDVKWMKLQMKEINDVIAPHKYLVVAVHNNGNVYMTSTHDL